MHRWLQQVAVKTDKDVGLTMDTDPHFASLDKSIPGRGAALSLEVLY